MSPSKGGVSRRTVQSQATRDRAQSHERSHQIERNVARVEADRKLERYCLYHNNNTTHVTDECKVLKAQAERMAAQHRSVGAGKYHNDRTNFQKKKSMQSFKQEIVKSVVKSLKECGQARSNKRRKVMQMEEFNMEQFHDLKVSDLVKIQKRNMSAFLQLGLLKI